MASKEVDRVPPSDRLCPELEEIAAFIDGRLSLEERARVTDHVGQCEACYMVFSESLRFQGENAPIEMPAGSTPGPARVSTSSKVLPALAAAAVVVLAVGATYSLLTRGQQSFQREPEVADLQQNARAALDRISRDLIMAGLETPPALAVIPGATDAANITIVYRDTDLPVWSPSSWSPCDSGLCEAIEVDIAQTAIPDPSETYRTGTNLLAMETTDCNRDGQNGIRSLRITKAPQSDAGTGILRLYVGPVDQSLSLPNGYNSAVLGDCAVIGRFRVVQYSASDGTMLRRDLSESPNWIPVASVDALHLEYAQGSANDFPNESRPADPEDSDTWITRVRVSVAGRSLGADLEGISPSTSASKGENLRKTFSTLVTLRNQVDPAWYETEGKE